MKDRVWADCGGIPRPGQHSSNGIVTRPRTHIDPPSFPTLDRVDRPRVMERGMDPVSCYYASESHCSVTESIRQLTVAADDIRSKVESLSGV